MQRTGALLRNALATLAGLALLAGCSFSLGRNEPRDVNTDTAGDVREEEDGGVLQGLFTRDPVDLPDAVRIADMREAVVERGYGGAIVRVTGVAPTQGFFNAALLPVNDGAPDAAGVVTLEFVAVPPLTPEAVGPERTRILTTAAFFQQLALRDVRAVRVVSGARTVTLPLPAPRTQPAASF